MDEALKSEIIACIENSVAKEFYSEMKIEFAGTNEKGEGYVADFIFATATGINENNTVKEIHLAIKFGKRSRKFRENLVFATDCYKRELFVYDKVFDAFQKFQLQKNLTDTFRAVPKCYGTFLSQNIEVLVLENLKKKGFELHDGSLPMNMQHIYLILKNYAKLHALSFALRDQDKDSLDQLVADYKSVMEKLISSTSFFKNNDFVSRKLKEFGREDLSVEYEKLTENGKDVILQTVLEDVPQESVIIHGDCHNNNFLFQYQNNNQENPLRVVIIDWQISQLHSPVIDLSYFLYCAASKKEFSQLDEILKFYYLHLSDFMEKLGSDSSKIFSWSTLMEHWKKYSIYGFLMSTSVIRIFYLRKEDTPSLDEYASRAEKDTMESVKLKNEDLFKERLLSIVDNYFCSTHT